MLKRIKNIQDVVDWGLCVGCGACYSACPNSAVKLFNFLSSGIRPVVDIKKCSDCSENCLTYCPGYNITAENTSPTPNDEIELGNTLEIWEGYAVNEEIRFKGSSGGVLSAIALYCLENEDMDFILHTGMDSEQPWLNKTCKSYNFQDIISRTGSRYATSSPCEGLRDIEENNKKCVFIGKPCDTAGVSMLRKKQEKLDKNLGIVLSFFCAGTPSTKGTLDLAKSLNVIPEEIKSLKYRGEGWPGEFQIISGENEKKYTVSYFESWSKLNKYRPFRCQLCPDGTGRNADISCGDAWHIYPQENNPGMSIVLVRTSKGKEILHHAMGAGYIKLNKITHKEVIQAQPLLDRHKWIWGRLLGMKLFFIPTPRVKGFYLFKSWGKLPLQEKIKTVAGTVKRILMRGLWHRNPVIY